MYIYARVYTHALLLTLISPCQPSRVHLVDTEPFSDTFGPKSRRKRPKLAAEDYSTLLEKVDSVNGTEPLSRCWVGGVT